MSDASNLSKAKCHGLKNNINALDKAILDLGSYVDKCNDVSYTNDYTELKNKSHDIILDTKDISSKIEDRLIEIEREEEAERVRREEERKRKEEERRIAQEKAYKEEARKFERDMEEAKRRRSKSYTRDICRRYDGLNHGVSHYLRPEYIAMYGMMQDALRHPTRRNDFFPAEEEHSYSSSSHRSFSSSSSMSHGGGSHRSFGSSMGHSSGGGASRKF